jgi:putative oxidoreductase
MKTVSRIAPVVLRTLFGLMFTAAGAVGLFHLAPQPAHSGAAAAFAGGLAASGYFFPLLKSIELVAGLLLLSGRLVPLTLVVLAPIVVNIAAFHFILAPEGALVAAFLVAAEAGLAWIHRDAFAPLLRWSSAPVHRTDHEGSQLSELSHAGRA